MPHEYLIYNLIVLAGPLLLSFDRRVQFRRRWKWAFPAILLSSVPFLIWDILVTGRHWWFNDQFSSSWRLAGLPAGEWLFFFTVPFACVFVWENLLVRYRASEGWRDRTPARLLHLLALPAGMGFLVMGKEYTGLMLIVVAGAALLDMALKTGILQRAQTPAFALILFMLILAFNGYLTARPVVLYGQAYQIGWRLVTIPIEDFGYGWSLMLLNLTLYERFRRGGFWTNASQ